jgi:hypothetical protein
MTTRLIELGMGGLATAAAATQGVGASSDWFSVVLQSGMAGIVVILLLKVIPDSSRANATRHREFLDALAVRDAAFMKALKEERESRERQNAAWLAIVTERGYCPVRDAKVHQGAPHQGPIHLEYKDSEHLTEKPTML